MKLIFRFIFVLILLLSSQYSFSEEKTSTDKITKDAEIGPQKKAKKKKSKEKAPTETSSQVTPVDNQKITVSLEMYDGFARAVFSGIDYVDLNPIIEGDSVMIDLKKPAEMNIAGYNSNNKYIRSYGLANDDRSIVFKMKGQSSKLRKFIADNGVGFDMFTNVGMTDQPQIAQAQQKKNVVIMSEIPGEAKTKPENEETLTEEVAVEKSATPEIPEIPIIITYPLDYMGPPTVEQRMNTDDFVGPLTHDAGKYAIYEVMKGYDDKVLEPTFTADKKLMLASFRFANPEAIGASFFKLGNYAYLLFDEKKPIYLDGFSKNKFVSAVRPIKDKKFTVLRFKLTGKNINDYKLISYRDKAAWNIEIHDKTSDLQGTFVTQLKYNAENTLGENRLSFKMKDISKPYTLIDPNTSEGLKVFTTSENGVGNTDEREFVDLELDQTAQGLVIREKSDYLTYEKDKKDKEKLYVTKLPNLLLSDEILAAGDTLTSEKKQMSKGYGIYSEQSIFPFPSALAELQKLNSKKKKKTDTKDKEAAEKDAAKAGEKKKDTEKEQPETAKNKDNEQEITEAGIVDHTLEMNNKIIAAPDSQKSALKKELANYYFKNGFYAESLGMLEDIIETDPTFTDIFNVKAMYGATEFFTKKYDDAKTSFDELLSESQNNPASNELKLWKWISANGDNKQRRVNEKLEDIDFVASFDKFMQQYPEDLRFQIGLSYINYLMEHQKMDDAKNILEVVSYGGVPKQFENDIKLINAKFLYLAGNYDDAAKLYQELINNVDDRKNRAFAIFEFNKQKLKLEQVDYQEAIKNFLLAATIWRDDYFEMDVLETVGNIQLSKNNYMDSLEAWKGLVQNFPQTAESVFILGKMKDVFIDLFDGGKVYDLPPLEVLRIYFRFRELMPVGEIGDRITRKVAKYFLDTDMIDDGLDIIRHQIVYRSKGNEKADLVLWLSNIMLEDDRLDDAIRSLDLLKADILAPETAQRIKNQRALFIAKKGKIQEALDMVRDDFSYSAESVRIEIFKQRGNWFGIMNKIEARLQGFMDTFPDPLSKDQMNDIFTLAVAYASQGDNDKLTKLNNDFVKRIENEKDLKLFTYLTSGNKRIDYADFESSSEVNKIQSFLNEYSYLPGNDWFSVAKILEPKAEKLTGKPIEELSEEDKNDVVRLALAYAELLNSTEERVVNDSKKKLATLSRNFKDIKVDRTTIDTFAILDNKVVPKDPDAVFEGKIKLADIPDFVGYYRGAKKFSELNISIRDKFKN